MHTAAPATSTLSLHDALPISCPHEAIIAVGDATRALEFALARNAVLILAVESAAWFYPATPEQVVDRKSTRLNSSHRCTSYAVFCLKKKNKTERLIIHATAPP